MKIKWYEVLEQVRNHAFKIITPHGSGTGFLLTHHAGRKLFGVATAYHVVDHAYLWEEPIKLVQTATNKQILLRQPDRFIFTNPTKDLAVIMMVRTDIECLAAPLSLVPPEKHMKPGNEIAWAGYPAVAPNEFSFFNGHISCYLHKELAYLVDGVAINGVSGGPAFTSIGEDTRILGVVTAYIPNRATGESLPGVCFVSAVEPLYDVLKDVQSLDEAKEKEAEQGVVADAPKARG